MSISIRDVERVAEMSRLELSEEEKAEFTKELNDILQIADKLEQVDTEGIEPMTHGLPLSNVMREDEVRASPPLEVVLRNAPDEEDGQFKVPAILD